MFNFGWDPEQFASLGSSFDVGDPFSPTPVAPVAVVKPTSVVSTSSNTFSGLPSNEDISFSSGDVYETPDKALGGFASFIGNLESQRRDTNKKYGLTRFDPMDYVREGLSGPRDLGNTAARDALTSYVKDNNMPLTQVRDGVTYHLTGGSETFNDMLHGRVRDGIWQDQGPVGTYSTVYVDTSQSMFQEVLSNPVLRAAAAVATGGVSEGVIAAGRGLTGETLHLNDYLAMAGSGYNLSQGNAGLLSGGSGAAATANNMVPSLGAAAEGMSALDAALLAQQGYGIYDEFKTAQDEEDEEDAAVQAAIDIYNSANEVVDQTGVTPDTFKPEQPLPEYDLAVEPIVYEPPSTEAGGGGAGEGGEAGGKAGGETGAVNTSGGEEVTIGNDPNFEERPVTPDDIASDDWDYRYPEGFLGGSFDDIDYNNDGVVTAQERDRWEHEATQSEEENPSIFIDTTIDTDTSTSGGTGTGTDTGSAGGTGTGTGTGAATGTDGTGASTGGSTGAGGATGTGDGTGSGTGTGSGDGSGDGSGSGDGTGDGDGSGIGIGSSGMLSPQRTTDDLFFKELFQMNTQARDTQQIVRAGQPLQTFQQRQRQLQPVDRPRLGMLTDPELLKRYKY